MIVRRCFVTGKKWIEPFDVAMELNKQLKQNGFPTDTIMPKDYAFY